MKKVKTTHRGRIEDGSKFNYLPPSPPPQQKSPQENHYQSSSSPVGRPPPFIAFMNSVVNCDHDNQNMEDDGDYLIEELKALLSSNAATASSSMNVATTTATTTTITTSTDSHLTSFPSFDMMGQDIDLFDMLESDDDESFAPSNLFPAMPGNNANDDD